MKKFQKINQSSNACIASSLAFLAKEELIKNKHYSEPITLKQMSAEKIKELEKLYNCKINLEDGKKKKYRIKK